MEMGREFLLGAVFGEWGADEHDNIYYLGGWIASGVVVLGDVRDIAATISRGDLVGTGLNLAAVIPGYGDAAKVSVIVGKFVVVHPELLKPAMVLMVGVAPHVDEAAETINALRKAHGDDVIDRLLRDGITENELKVVVNSNGNLLRTLAVAFRFPDPIFISGVREQSPRREREGRRDDRTCRPQLQNLHPRLAPGGLAPGPPRREDRRGRRLSGVRVRCFDILWASTETIS